MDEQKMKELLIDTFNTVSHGYDDHALRFFPASAKNLAGFLGLRGNRGIGQAMFNQIREWCRGKEIQRIEARVAVTNEISMRFWRKVGLMPYLEILYAELRDRL